MNVNRNRNSYDDPEEMMPHYDTAVMVALCISNTILVFLRKKLGFRLLNPRWLIIAMLIGFGAGYMEFNSQDATVAMRQDGLAMMILAACMSMQAGAQRWKARPEAHGAGDHIHTRSRGYSVFMRLFGPLRVSQASVQRWFEPMFVWGVGAYLVKHNWELCGWWLAISGACLGIVESVVAKYQKVAFMDLRDNRIDAQLLQSADSAPPSQPAGKTPPVPRQQTATLSPDVLRLKEHKKSPFGK